MFNVLDHLWLIPVLPLAASIVIAVFGSRFLKSQSHWPCVLAIAGSCVLSVLLLIAVAQRLSDARLSTRITPGLERVR